MIKKVSSYTFCIVDDKLLLDPTNEEVNASSYYFSIIKFEKEEKKPEFLIHKISGDVIKSSILKEAFDIIS